MFRKLYNQAILTGTLRPDGPLLIVQGGAALDPMAPDLAFVRTVRDGAPTVYLPGSSLKGVLRAHAERILATQVGESAAEDPFNFETLRRKRANDENKKERKERLTSAVFSLSCEADRLFGSTEIAGRFRIGDAFPTPETLAEANRTEVRYGVAIDRAKQSVQVGPFEQEAVTSGRFAFRALLENFELWMLSLVLQAFQDLNDGLVQVGHAKSRGFGTVVIDQASLLLRWPGKAPGKLEGAGARETEATVRDAYGLSAEDAVDLPAGAAEAREGLFNGYRFQDWTSIGSVLGAVSGAPWSRFLERAREEAARA